MNKPLSQSEFKTIYSKVPRLTVEVIIKNSNGLLLVKRSIFPYEGYWHIPGGTVYYKETLNEAAVRVAKSELNVEIKINNFLGFIYYPELIKNYGWDWPVGAAYEAKIINGKLVGSNEGIQIKYFKKLPQKVIPSQKKFLLEHYLI